MENIAEAGPQELRLGMLAFTQFLELDCRISFFEDGLDGFIALLATFDIFTLERVQHEGLLAFFLVNATSGFLPQCTIGNQSGQPARSLEQRVPRIFRQGVLHGFDHMGESVQSHHVGGTESGRFRTAQTRAGQVINHIEADAVFFGIGDSRQHGEHADTVGYKVRGVLGTDHTLAEGRHQETLEIVEHLRITGHARDDFHKVHVARRIEEVHATETAAGIGRAGFSQLVDAQAGSIGGKNGVLTQKRGDLGIKVCFPVHPFGNGFNNDVALFEQRQMFVVIGRSDEIGPVLACQGGRLQFFEPFNGFLGNGAFVAFFCGQIEENSRHFGVDEVSGNLRAHHPGTEHGYLANDELGLRHGFLWLQTD